MREEAEVFGGTQSMIGVFTPAPAADGEPPPAVILLNAGLIHRVGPRRIHVRIARTLAARGVPCLRLDLTGIGDSDNRGDGLSLLDGSVADVREAMDHLERTRGHRRFIVGGICWGAIVSYLSLAQEPRIAGAMLVDPQDFGAGLGPQPVAVAEDETRVRHYWRSVGSRPIGERLRRLLTGKSDYGYAIGVIRKQLAGFLRSRGRTDRIGAEIASRLRTFCEGGGRVLLVYTEHANSLDAYRIMVGKRLDDLTQEGGPLTLSILAGADHEFTSLASQEKLVATLGTWVAAGRARAG